MIQKLNFHSIISSKIKGQGHWMQNVIALYFKYVNHT